MKRSFSHIKSHSFHGKRFKIVWRVLDKENHGKCDDPSERRKNIFIGPNLEEKDLLETALHEGLHAAFFSIDEPHVDRAAEDIASLLWRMGFRLQE